MLKKNFRPAGMRVFAVRAYITGDSRLTPHTLGRCLPRSFRPAVARAGPNPGAVQRSVGLSLLAIRSRASGPRRGGMHDVKG